MKTILVSFVMTCTFCFAEERDLAAERAAIQKAHDELPPAVKDAKRAEFEAGIAALAGKWEYLPDEPGGVSHNRKATLVITERSFTTEDAVSKSSENIFYKSFDAQKKVLHFTIGARPAMSNEGLLKCEFGEGGKAKIFALNTNGGLWMLAYSLRKVSDDADAVNRYRKGGFQK